MEARRQSGAGTAALPVSYADRIPPVQTGKQRQASSLGLRSHCKWRKETLLDV